MNKYVITVLIFCFASYAMATTFYRAKDGKWYSINEKTGDRREIFSAQQLRKPRYQESRLIPQNNPYDTSFYSDSTYPTQDGTNRNMGNR